MGFWGFGIVADKILPPLKVIQYSLFGVSQELVGMTSALFRSMGLPQTLRRYEVRHGEYACDKEHTAIQARFRSLPVTWSCISL